MMDLWDTSSRASEGFDYDLSTFYAESAESSSGAVKQPAKDNITLTIAQGQTGTMKVLMLLDPRGCIHATAGILPTKSLSIPPDLCDSALKILEMFFPAMPVLTGASNLALPIPQEMGYQFSWIEEDIAEGGSPVWAVTPDILDAMGKAIWAYTPSSITEGWLRMNPILLEFALLNDHRDPVVINKELNSMNLIITSKKQSRTELRPGNLVEEGKANGGSIFYIHLGDMVRQDDIPDIEFSAPGWDFKSFVSDKYGKYWAATPTAPVTLESGELITITVKNLAVYASGTQAHLYFDYYGIIGLNDGVYSELLAVQSSSLGLQV